jgi:hypothetical protein
MLFMSALPSSADKASAPSVRALSISARGTHWYRIKVVHQTAWQGCEVKATLYDHDGPLYHARGPSAFEALSELLNHPILQAHRTFDVARSANGESSTPEHSPEEHQQIENGKTV